jgi:hypothetical protein
MVALDDGPDADKPLEFYAHARARGAHAYIPRFACVVSRRTANVVSHARQPRLGIILRDRSARRGEAVFDRKAVSARPAGDHAAHGGQVVRLAGARLAAFRVELGFHLRQREAVSPQR